MKILLVDDSNAILMIVGQMLKEANIDFVTAKNGQEALDIIESEEVIDLMLLDWNMPQMSGLELLEMNMKTKLINFPIIMMTTENSPEKIMQAINLGANEYIMKPFTPDILFSKVEAVYKQAA